MTVSVPNPVGFAAGEAGRRAALINIFRKREEAPPPAPPPAAPPSPAVKKFIPGPVLLIGPPGVGKGTQAKALMAEFGVPQISTGDLFRKHRSEHTDLGLIADKYIAHGQLVPDDFVNDMVKERLAEPDCVNGYVLDGFPRTNDQAFWLDHYLAETRSRYPVVVMSIMVDQDDLLKRITGRRICPEGHIYNIHTQPPKRAGVCDIDRLPLTQRKDDSEAVFHERMKVFQEETAPVISHYKGQGRFALVNGMQSVEAVTQDIRFKLQKLRTQPTASTGVHRLSDLFPGGLPGNTEGA